jgi:hypothetical protein
MIFILELQKLKVKIYRYNLIRVFTNCCKPLEVLLLKQYRYRDQIQILIYRTIHCKKRISIFLSPAGMSLTKLSLVGNNDVINKLFPPRESLVSDIPAGDGNIEKLFYGVVTKKRLLRLYSVQYVKFPR